MTRRERKYFLASVDGLVAAILQHETSWQGRWDQFAAAMRGFFELGRDRHKPQTLYREIGGPIAQRLIAALGDPSVIELPQALLYFASADPSHRDASRVWQSEHQEELLTWSEQYPDLPAFDEVERAPAATLVDFGKLPRCSDGGYMRNLRQSALLVLQGDRTGPAIALTRLMRALAGYYETGQVIGERRPDAVVRDADSKAIEIFAAFIEKRLRPANGEVEMAVQDLVEQTQRDAPRALQTFYGLAGRPPLEGGE